MSNRETPTAQLRRLMGAHYEFDIDLPVEFYPKAISCILDLEQQAEAALEQIKMQNQRIARLAKENATMKYMLETCRDVTDDIYNDPIRLDAEHDVIGDYKWRCVKLKDEIVRTLSSLSPSTE